MPAVVGAIKVNSISTSGIFHVGDAFVLNPRSTTKTFAGAGSFNTGDGLTVRSDYSVTTTKDSDLLDQNIASVL